MDHKIWELAKMLAVTHKKENNKIKIIVKELEEIHNQI